MRYSIELTRNASSDLARAIEWENERSPQLGKRLTAQLERKFASLMVTPYLGSIRYENVRCTPIDIFQYLIHYVVDDTRKTVIILRILHVK